MSLASPAWAAELTGKAFELGLEILPSAQRVAALANAPDPFAKPFLERIRVVGKATGLTVDAVMIESADELEATFAAVDKNRPDAVIVQLTLGLKRLAELALKYRLPAASILGEFLEEGGLMSYGVVADRGSP